MAAGGGFAERLSGWLLERYSGRLSDVIVFVPTSRVAARVRAKLSAQMTGVLPAVLPLRGNGELADLLGITMDAVVSAEVAMLEIAEVLKAQAREDESGLEARKGERLWRRVESLYRMFDRLALHGLTAQDLRQTVPESMVGLWEAQAATLIGVMRHMERWLARRNEVLAGTAERRVLERAAEILGKDGCGWIPVVAGALDGIPAAHAVAKVAATRGYVLVPELGPVTEELVKEFLAEMGAGEVLATARSARLATPSHMSDDMFAGRDGEALTLPSIRKNEWGNVAECVAETDWDEAWVAALGVKRAVDKGQKRVAVVSPSGVLLRRVSGLLARWNVVVPVSGELCMDHTPAGREVLAVANWGMGGGRAAEWLDAMRGGGLSGSQGFRVSGFADIMAALEPLREMEAWLDLDDWRALMRAVLGRTAAPVTPVSDGVFLLGPLDARLLDFDTVIAAGCVEGTWPGSGQDAWLSEAHLRALGLPDTARRAQLAGTEFESVVAGGSGEVIITRARTVEGKEMVPSRFIQGCRDVGVSGFQERELVAVLEEVKAGAVRHDGELGVFVPQGKLWPSRWSASLTEALLACPYKALGERVLRLAPAEPLTPEVDARTAGLLAHRWLERIGKEIPSVTEGTAEKVVARLLELAAFELRHETAVIRAIWTAKFAKLAPALVAQWLADGRRVDAVEKRLSRDVGAVTVTATLDRVEADTAGKVIIDFKTSTPPSWAQVGSGEKPQLAMEAWLLAGSQDVGGLGSQDRVVAGVEYWQLRGYGVNPLVVKRAGEKKSPPLEQLVAPVESGLTRLVETFGDGAPFPAVPDLAGGGLLATGHCSWCKLAGVCRRKAAGMGEIV